MATYLQIKWTKSFHDVKSVEGKQLNIISKTSVCIELQDYKTITKFYIAEFLSDEAIIGMSLLNNFSAMKIKLPGPLPELVINSVSDSSNIKEICNKSSMLNIEPVSVFNVRNKIKPIRAPSRYYKREDIDFIRNEIKNLLHDGIIIPSKSSWRSQIVITKSDNHKKRMCIDYASTINRYTELDGFPIPIINNVLRQLQGNYIFIRLDMRAAYHQIPLHEKDRSITAFEADGNLY